MYLQFSWREYKVIHASIQGIIHGVSRIKGRVPDWALQYLDILLLQVVEAEIIVLENESLAPFMYMTIQDNMSI